MSDAIRPDHYQECSIECLDIMKIAFGSEKVYWFCVINAYKYLHRHLHKNGLEDLKKARQYLQFARDIDLGEPCLIELTDMVWKYERKYNDTEIDEGYQE